MGFLRGKKPGARCLICLFSGSCLPFGFEDQAFRPHRPSEQAYPKLRVIHFLLLSTAVCDHRFLGRSSSAFVEWFYLDSPKAGCFSEVTLEVTLAWPSKSENVTY